MGTVLTPTAHAKLVLHAAKHPSQSVFGLLLGTGNEAIDVVPVTHNFLALSSVFEAAIEQTNLYAATQSSQLRIIGAYVANANLEDTELSPLAAHLALAAAGGVDAPVVLVIDNAKILDGEKSLGLLPFKQQNGAWKPAQGVVTLKGDVFKTLQLIRKALETNCQSLVYDFDNHLDNAALDWLKNGQITQALQLKA
ncbi:hypothetical protein CcCBS67573_g08925 [Chytriomyces confervae]|uniref:MPN domain-containing protein n=1 Tax=Chytriomyces confervae TaxID=246404 RepID=A0A507EBE5_9FUNG|nr:hypothetical protein CcCBS67573_g08925 [Chytriomyces confervae]